MSSETSNRSFSTKRRVAVLILILLIMVLAVGLFRFIRHRLEYALTDAVFVASDSLTEIGFDRVSGVLTELPVNEGDRVKKGQLLARIDPQRYRLEVKKLAAAVQTAVEKRAALQLKRQRLQQEFELRTKLATEEIRRVGRQQQAAAAKVASLQARIDQLQRDHQRMVNLFAQQVIPRQKLEQSSTQLEAARAERLALQRDQQAFNPVRKAARLQRQLSRVQQQQLLELDRDLAAAAAGVARLRSMQEKAQQDLADTELRSPLDGRLAKRFINLGGDVTPGRAVMALVDPQDIYIIALLEETKLEGVEPGAQVLIRIDAYSDQQWQGKVEQVLPASAATFALAPRDISAGEFTKVAQRIPVRIRITGGSLDKLRVGLGGEVEIRRKDS